MGRSQRLQLSVWAEGLPMPEHGKRNAFAVVGILKQDDDNGTDDDMDESGMTMELLGQTEAIPKMDTPDWTKLFFLNYTFGAANSTIAVVSILNNNSNNSSGNTLLGSTTFDLRQVLISPGSVLGKELKEGGYVFVSLEKVTESGCLKFQIRGLHLTNTEIGMGLINKSDPFYELSRLRVSARLGMPMWDTVFRSPYINNNLNPLWAESYIDVDALCGGKFDQKFRIAVYDYNNSGNHTYMGCVKVSLDEFLAAVTEGSKDVQARKVDTSKALLLEKDGKQTGMLVVCEARVTEARRESSRRSDSTVYIAPDNCHTASKAELFETEPDDMEALEPIFLNYIAGGCKLHVTVAMDGTPLANEGMDTSVVASVCSILSSYSTDQLYSIYLFGYKQGDTQCDFLEVTKPGSEVEGVDMILCTIRDTLGSISNSSSPCGSRNLASVLARAAQNARDRLKKSQSYSIALFIVHGPPDDLSNTIAALEEADDAPLSVLIVCVGVADFSSYQSLQKRTLSSGANARDFVNIAVYRELQSDHISLRRACVDSIPRQLESLFSSKHILPLVPVDDVETHVAAYDAADDLDVQITFSESGEAISMTAKPKVQSRGLFGDFSKPSGHKAGSNDKGIVQKFIKKEMKKQFGRYRRRIQTEVTKFAKQKFGM